MKRMTLAAIAATVATTATGAAVSARIIEMREYAAPSVLSVSTTQVGRQTYRAITGLDRQAPYLVIEELGWATNNRGRRGQGAPQIQDDQDRDLRDRFDDRNGRRGTLAVRSQRQIAILEVGRQRIEVNRLRYLDIDGWSRDGRLTFSAVAGRRTHRCTVAPGEAQASCDGAWEDGGYDGGGINPGSGPGPRPGTNPSPGPGPGPSYPPPPPPRPGNGGGYDGGGINPGGGSGGSSGNSGGGYDGGGINPGPGGGSPQSGGEIERLRVITKACGEAFFATAQRDNCIQLVRGASVDLLPAVAACGQAIASTNDRLACLTQAASVPGDAASIIKQCARSFLGAQDTLTCLRTVATQNLPLAVIPACEGAVYGSQERFRCMNATASSRVDPVSLISYCKENNTGSAAVISCIEKYR